MILWVIKLYFEEMTSTLWVVNTYCKMFEGVPTSPTFSLEATSKGVDMYSDLLALSTEMSITMNNSIVV